MKKNKSKLIHIDIDENAYTILQLEKSRLAERGISASLSEIIRLMDSYRLNPVGDTYTNPEYDRLPSKKSGCVII